MQDDSAHVALQREFGFEICEVGEGFGVAVTLASFGFSNGLGFVWSDVFVGSKLLFDSNELAPRDQGGGGLTVLADHGLVADGPGGHYTSCARFVSCGFGFRGVRPSVADFELLDVSGSDELGGHAIVFLGTDE